MVHYKGVRLLAMKISQNLDAKSEQGEKKRVHILKLVQSLTKFKFKIESGLNFLITFEPALRKVTQLEMKFQILVVLLFVLLCLSDAGRVKRDRRRSRCVHLPRIQCESRGDAGCQWNETEETCGSVFDGIQCFRLSKEECESNENRGCEWFGGCQARF